MQRFAYVVRYDEDTLRQIRNWLIENMPVSDGSWASNPLPLWNQDTGGIENRMQFTIFQEEFAMMFKLTFNDVIVASEVK